MKLFIVATPLFNIDMSVEAYNLEFQNATNLFGMAQDYRALDGIMHSPGIDVLNQIGLDPFTGGKPIFFQVNHYMLLAGLVKDCNTPPHSTVFIFTKDMPLKSDYLERCKELDSLGFSIALSGIEYTCESEPFFDLSKYVILDADDPECMSTLRLIRIKYPKIAAIIKNIKYKAEYDEIKQVPNAYFAGNFYVQPITRGLSKVSPLKTNALQILRVIGEDDYDLDDVSRIVARDVSLSISLLKFINSPMIGMTSKVTSIKGAVALLGQQETRKWVMVVVSKYLGEDKPNEITKTALIRAKFAENLATTFEMGMHANALFIMGLFSLLDIILEKPMKEAVKEIFIESKIKKALVNREGDFAPVLDLLYYYEQADWKGVCYIVVVYNLDVEKVCNAFIDALQWYKALLDNISDSEDENA